MNKRTELEANVLINANAGGGVTKCRPYLCKALSTLATKVAEIGRRLSPTVAVFGDYSRQCGRGFNSSVN